MKLRGSHKIAIGAILLGAGGYYGYQIYSAKVVDGLQFSELKPGQFSIVGINTGRQYKIIVSNQIAQLVEISGSDELGTGDMSDPDAEQGTNKKRVPLRELLQSLQGDTVALGKLVTTMNDQLRKADMPGFNIYWTSEDIQKALGGDQALRDKLEADLNVKLDGTPLDSIRISAIRNGIVIKAHVPIEVSVEGQKKTLQAPIEIPFRPQFTLDVEKQFIDDFNPTPETIKGSYLEVATKVNEETGRKENVANALRVRSDEKELIRQFAEAPQSVLANAKVILNESFIESASLSETKGTTKQKLWEMALNLTPEGRNRLWQFSRRGNIGTQLLVIHEGVAIAAPRIRHELAQSYVSITQLPEHGLAQDTVEYLNRKNSKQ